MATKNEVQQIELSIETEDGRCDATLHLPCRCGPWPGVILYTDAAGPRPAMRTAAERLASMGYAVLLPDPYYRAAPYEPLSMERVFGDPGERRRAEALFEGLTPGQSLKDACSFLDALAARDEVGGIAVGVVGYCMGGTTALATAGRYAARVAAVASIHGGNLAVDGDPTSPHLAAHRISAPVYLAVAEDDPSFPPEQEARLQEAFRAGQVRATIEHYAAPHGFAVVDAPVFDPVCYERHWEALGAVLSALWP